MSAGANDMHDDAGGELRAVNNSGHYSTFLYAQVTVLKGTGLSSQGYWLSSQGYWLSR